MKPTWLRLSSSILRFNLFMSVLLPEAVHQKGNDSDNNDKEHRVAALNKGQYPLIILSAEIAQGKEYCRGAAERQRINEKKMMQFHANQTAGHEYRVAGAEGNKSAEIKGFLTIFLKIRFQMVDFVHRNHTTDKPMRRDPVQEISSYKIAPDIADKRACHAERNDLP